MCVYIYTISSVSNGHINILAIVKNIAMNIRIHVIFKLNIFFFFLKKTKSRSGNSGFNTSFSF